MGFLRKHWLTIIAIFIGIIVSNYFYQRTKFEREPVFCVESSKTRIIDYEKLGLSPLRIIRKNGEEIKGDISAVRFAFWNKGKLSIKKDNILEPLIIHLDDEDAEILDKKILKESRTVVKPNLSFDYSEEVKTRLYLDFDIMERNDGISGQIIYKGDPEAELLIRGTIEDKKTIESKNTLFERKSGNISLMSGIILIGVFVMIIVFFLCENYISKLEYGNIKIFRFISWLIPIMSGFLIYFLLYILTPKLEIPISIIP